METTATLTPEQREYLTTFASENPYWVNYKAEDGRFDGIVLSVRDICIGLAASHPEDVEPEDFFREVLAIFTA